MNCAICGGPIPESAWSLKDEAAELAYVERTGEEHRPLYCSPGCFRIACEEVTSSASQSRQEEKGER